MKKYIVLVTMFILSTMLLSGCYWYIDDGRGPRHGYYYNSHHGPGHGRSR